MRMRITTTRSCRLLSELWRPTWGAAFVAGAVQVPETPNEIAESSHRAPPKPSSLLWHWHPHRIEGIEKRFDFSQPQEDCEACRPYLDGILSRSHSSTDTDTDADTHTDSRASARKGSAINQPVSREIGTRCQHRNDFVHPSMTQPNLAQPQPSIRHLQAELAAA